jgi:hypothetical protein
LHFSSLFISSHFPDSLFPAQHKRGRVKATDKRIAGDQQVLMHRETASPESAKPSEVEEPPSYAESAEAAKLDGDAVLTGQQEESPSAPAITDMVESAETEEDEPTPGADDHEDAPVRGESTPLMGQMKVAPKDEYAKRGVLWHLVNGRLSVPRFLLIGTVGFVFVLLVALLGITIYLAANKSVPVHWSACLASNRTGLESGQSTICIVCTASEDGTTTANIVCTKGDISISLRCDSSSLALSAVSVLSRWS